MNERKHSALRGQISVIVVAMVAVATILVVETGIAEAADDDIHWTAHARWGVEYDDNPHRLESEDGENAIGSGDSLLRYLLGGDIVSDVGDSGQVSATLQHGGTVFRQETDANAVLTEVSGAGLWRPGKQFSLQLRADVKDRSESGDHRRDYTRGSLALRGGRSIGPVQLRADGGWRFLAYKPSPPSSHRGPFVGAGARWLVRNDLALDASWTHSWRDYTMTAWEVRDDQFVSIGEPRADDHDLWRVVARYQRHINASLRYQYAKNRSNSHGQQMARHGVEASVTVPVMWDVFLSARGEIQRTRYEDPVLFDDVMLLDEDHRNTLVAAVNRQIAGPWDLEFRYSLFTQEFGVGGEYRRQTVALAIRAYFDEGE